MNYYDVLCIRSCLMDLQTVFDIYISHPCTIPYKTLQFYTVICDLWLMAAKGLISTLTKSNECVLYTVL